MAALLSFLGSIVCCRQWIPDCSFHDSILCPAATLTAPRQVTYTEEMTQAFNSLLQSFASAPALGLPDYKKSFVLYCVVRGPAFAAILAQMQGTHYRPVAYISKKLPIQVQGMPSCLQAMAACAMTIKEASKITLGTDTVLYTTHTVVHLLQNISTQHMTAQRSNGYEIVLLNIHGLTIKSCSETTPAVKLLHSLLRLPTDIAPSHDCSMEQILPHPEKILLTLPTLSFSDKSLSAVSRTKSQHLHRQ